MGSGKMDIIFLKNQPSIIPQFHYSMVEAKTEASVILYFSRRGGIESVRHLCSLLLADIETGFFSNDLKYSQ
jgi:hypothetical protein